MSTKAKGVFEVSSPQKLVGAAYDRIFKTPLPKLSSKETHSGKNRMPESPVNPSQLLFIEGNKPIEREMQYQNFGRVDTTYVGIHSQRANNLKKDNSPIPKHKNYDFYDMNSSKSSF